MTLGIHHFNSSDFETTCMIFYMDIYKSTVHTMVERTAFMKVRLFLRLCNMPSNIVETMMDVMQSEAI